MTRLGTSVSKQAVLNIKVGESAEESLARAGKAMEALQAGKTPKPYFGVGFAEVGQMLAVFTPRRWELIARLREAGPLSAAELARQLKRDYKNVHTDVAALIDWLAIERTADGLVFVPWSEIVVEMKLPGKLAA
jgi:predicted transcriptional regulator